MKKTILHKITFVIFGLLITMASVWAQPATVSVAGVPGGTLDKFVTGTAGEDPDLATTGTQVSYLVYPDAVLNPSWAEGADAKNTNFLTTDFTWTIPAAFSSTVPATIHYVTLNITGAAGATGNITVVENSAASCAGSTTTMAVKVVAQPTVTDAAVTDGSIPINSICVSGTNGSLGAAIPTFSVTKTIDASITTPNIRVKATLDLTALVGGATSNIFTDVVLNVDAATGNINATDLASAIPGGKLDTWGVYTLTISSVSDKISRKDLNAAGGYFTVTGVTTTYSVLKTPTTGPIYHIKNDNSL
jgi:hypothetical protein